MIKVNCLNAISKVGTGLLTDNYQITENVDEAQAILVRSAAMHDMQFSDNLLAIARAGAGVNNIPLDRCAEEGIVVFNTPGANANGVKELAVCAMLLASRDIIGGIDWVQSIKEEPEVAKMVEKGKGKFAGTELKGKKLGIIGLGAIGGPLANIAVDLGMEVYGCDPYLSVDAAWNISSKVKHVKTREEIFSTCDFISVHTPLVDNADPNVNTKKMINKDTIAMMKDGVIIINMARDLLVDDEAMEEALNSGKVRKYVTDFPNPKTAGMAGVIAIPHLGASTEESEDNCAIMAVNQIMDFIENGNIKNSVNFPACDMGVCKTAARVTILHRNIPNMLTQFTQVMAEKNINISEMSNKSRGNYSYAILDVDSPATEDLCNAIAAIEGVLKVRIVK